MKYDRLYNFISPVTGKIAYYSQFPYLPEDYIIVGNKDNEAETSPILIDIRLNMMDMRNDINSLQKNKIPDISDSKFIIQIPDTKLPNAQALSELDSGVLGNNNGVIEILQRVSGPLSSSDNNIARFDGETGQVIKDSKVKINDDGELYANSLYVKTISFNNVYITGFKENALLNKNIIYHLPLNGGIIDDALSIDYIKLDGTIQTKWSATFKKPKDDPSASPVYVPTTPIPIPIPIPITTIITIPGLVPVGTTISTPAQIYPNTGNISTPGNINANDFKGNNADFSGDLNVNGDLNGNNADFRGDLSTNGNLSTQGDISSSGNISSDGDIHSGGNINSDGDIFSLGDIIANGNVRGDSFDFEDLSEVSNDFVRMEAPFDLDHSYKIELPDAEPIMQEQIQPPNQRVLQTAWRRMRPDQVNTNSLRSTNTNANLSITKLSWSEIVVENPLTINFIPKTSTSNEKMILGYDGGGVFQVIDIPYAVNLIYGTLNNIDGSFNGFNSGSKNHSIKIKTSYNHKIDGSNSSIGLFNRYDNGFNLKNETNTDNKCIFKFQNIENNIITDLFSYNPISNYLKFTKPIVDIPYAIDFVYGTLSNIDSNFNGFNSGSKNHSIKIKTSYNHKIDGSKSAIKLLNRYDNGFIIQNDTDTLDNCIFRIQNITDNIITDLLYYNQTNNSFNFIKSLEVPDPTSAKHPTTKEYVDTIGKGVTSITAGTGLIGGTITSTGTISIANTGINAGNYNFSNFTVNQQGQLISASNGSPTNTTNRTIAVWGDNTGSSLLNTKITVDETGNMVSTNGTSTFLNQQINNADSTGSLLFKSNNYTLKLKLNQSLQNNILWYLPTTNIPGFFKNNGFGQITWSTLSSSDISNFSASVTSFRLNQFAPPDLNLNLNYKQITNLADPINAQDAATRNYIDLKPIYTSGDFKIKLNSDNHCAILFERNDTYYETTGNKAALYVDSDGKLCFTNNNGTVIIGGA